MKLLLKINFSAYQAYRIVIFKLKLRFHKKRINNPLFICMDNIPYKIIIFKNIN